MVAVEALRRLEHVPAEQKHTIRAIRVSNIHANEAKCGEERRGVEKGSTLQQQQQRTRMPRRRTPGVGGSHRLVEMHPQLAQGGGPFMMAADSADDRAVRLRAVSMRILAADICKRERGRQTDRQTGTRR